jgi:hypothetical protein
MVKLYGVLDPDRSRDVVRDANNYIKSRLVLGDIEVISSLNGRGMFTFTVKDVIRGKELFTHSGSIEEAQRKETER